MSEEQNPDHHEFDISALEPTKHDFHQEGDFLVCGMPGHKHASRIPNSKVLSRNAEGELYLADIVLADQPKS